MIWGIGWFFCGLIAMAIGQRKGEGLSGLFGGWLFGPLGILLAMLGSGNRMPCPFCSERVIKTAKVCPHCQRDLEAEKQKPKVEVEKQKPKVVRPYWKRALENGATYWIIFSVLVGVPLFFSQSDDKKKEAVYFDRPLFIKDKAVVCDAKSELQYVQHEFVTLGFTATNALDSGQVFRGCMEFKSAQVQFVSLEGDYAVINYGSNTYGYISVSDLHN
jgi:hypothetical protein